MLGLGSWLGSATKEFISELGSEVNGFRADVTTNSEGTPGLAQESGLAQAVIGHSSQKREGRQQEQSTAVNSKCKDDIHSDAAAQRQDVGSTVQTLVSGPLNCITGETHAVQQRGKLPQFNRQLSPDAKNAAVIVNSHTGHVAHGTSGLSAPIQSSSSGLLKDTLLAAAADDDDIFWGDGADDDCDGNGLSHHGTSCAPTTMPAVDAMAASSSTVPTSGHEEASTPLDSDPSGMHATATVARLHEPLESSSSDRTAFQELETRYSALEAANTRLREECETLKASLCKAESLAEEMRSERDSALAAAAARTRGPRMEPTVTQGSEPSGPLWDVQRSAPVPQEDWRRQLREEVHAAVRAEAPGLRLEADAKLHGALELIHRELRRLGCSKEQEGEG